MVVIQPCNCASIFMIHIFTDTLLAHYSLKLVARYRNITNWMPSSVYTYQPVHLDWLRKFHACSTWFTLHSPWWISFVALKSKKIKLCSKEPRNSVSPSVILNILRIKKWKRMGMYNTVVKYVLLLEILRRNLEVFRMVVLRWIYMNMFYES